MSFAPTEQSFEQRRSRFIVCVSRKREPRVGRFEKLTDRDRQRLRSKIVRARKRALNAKRNELPLLLLYFLQLLSRSDPDPKD